MNVCYLYYRRQLVKDFSQLPRFQPDTRLIINLLSIHIFFHEMCEFVKKILIKKQSICQEIKFSNPYIFPTWWCKPLLFQTKIIWSNRKLSLKCLRSIALGCKDIGIKNQNSYTCITLITNLGEIMKQNEISSIQSCIILCGLVYPFELLMLKFNLFTI